MNPYIRRVQHLQTFTSAKLANLFKSTSAKFHGHQPVCFLAIIFEGAGDNTLP